MKTAIFFTSEEKDYKVPQNLIFVGYNGKDLLNLENQKITENKNYIIRNLPERIIDLNKINLSHHNILTDNFAPVDYLISKEFTNLQ